MSKKDSALGRVLFVSGSMVETARNALLWVKQDDPTFRRQSNLRDF